MSKHYKDIRCSIYQTLNHSEVLVCIVFKLSTQYMCARSKITSVLTRLVRLRDKAVTSPAGPGVDGSDGD